MAEKLLRFKDVLKLEGIGPLDNPKKKLSFDDMHVTNYMPGEDEQINYRAYRRHRTIGVGEGGPVGEAYDPASGQHAKNVSMGYTGKHMVLKNPLDKKKHTHVFDIEKQANKVGMGEDADVDEALTVSQRLRKKQQLKRIMPKIKLGRERAKRRIASKEKLLKRSRKQARAAILKKLTKDIPKSELTYARRQELEKRLEKPAMKRRIDMIAKKMFPKVRQAELAKKRGGSK